MMNIKNLNYLVLSLLLVFSACEKKDDEKPGAAPTVNAGQDVTATVNSSVQLSGTASDPDQDALTTTWSVTSAPQGSSASISNASSLTATFTPDVVGNYTLRLTVDDNVYDPVFDELIITAEEAQGEPPVAVIRDDENKSISEANENNIVTVNSTYLLDGSGSTDPDSEDLTYTWEVTASPDGAVSTITPNEDGDMADFKHDLIGEYTVQLTVTDPEGNTNSVTVTLIATADPVIIDESISVATTWPNVFENPALPDYYVIADISISQELTIAPGVKVMFEPNRGMTVSGNSGALVAIGKEDSLIVLTAEDSLNGWDGIIFFNENTQNEFNYADISYGGQNDFGSGVLAANIGIDNNGALKITNSTVSNSFNYGIFIQDGGQITTFADNSFSENENNPIALAINQAVNLDGNSVYENNSDNTVEILSSTLNTDEEQTIPVLAGGVSYFVASNITISSGLTVSAGSSFEFDSDGYLQVNSAGYLIANGTEADSITFTASEAVNGWGGIAFFSTDNRNKFSYASLSYGGTRDFGSGIEPSVIGVDNNGNIKITNSTIANSLGDYGIHVQDGGQISEFAENRFINNGNSPIGIPLSVAGILDAASTFSGNSDNSVELYQSTLNANDTQTLPAFLDETPYYVSGNLTVSSDLVIKPGAYFEANQDVEIQVNSSGSISAVANADSLITFTARSEGDGWSGIVFFSSKSINRFEYVDISFGGGVAFGSGVDAANIGIDNSGKLAISNSIIRDSKANGIFVQSGGELVDASNNPFTTQTELEDAGNTFSGNAGDPSNL